MHRWFRVYEDLIDDPKVQRLPDGLFKMLVNLWCLASRNNGRLPPLDEIAFALRMDEETCSDNMNELHRRKLLDDVTGVLSPHNWNGRQFKSDVTDPTNAERQKRYRETKRNGHHNAKDRYGSVTDKRPETETESDTESETDPENREKDARAHEGGGFHWPADYRAQFEALYPNKIGMVVGLKALDAARVGGKVSWGVVIEALKSYAEKTDDRAWLGPKRWIEEERWNDRPGKPTGNGVAKSTAGDRARRLARQVEAREREGADRRPADAVGGAELGGDDARLVPGRKGPPG